MHPCTYHAFHPSYKIMGIFELGSKWTLQILNLMSFRLGDIQFKALLERILRVQIQNFQRKGFYERKIAHESFHCLFFYLEII